MGGHAVSSKHLLKGPGRLALAPPVCVFVWWGALLSSTPRAVTLKPQFPGMQVWDPHLEKKTTCLLGFIWFQGRQLRLTLKITKHANSFNKQMFFISASQII